MKITLILGLILIAYCQETIPGGYKEIRVQQFMNENDNISDFIIAVLDEQAGDGYRLWKINHVYEQIVSGTNYKMIADYVNKEDHNAFKRFEIIIYDQPWTNTREVVQVNQIDLRVPPKSKQSTHYGNWTEVDKKSFLEQNKNIQERLVKYISEKLQRECQIKEIYNVKEQFIAGRTFCIQVLLTDNTKLRIIVYHNPYTKVPEVVQMEKIVRFED